MIKQYQPKWFRGWKLASILIFLIVGALLGSLQAGDPSDDPKAVAGGVMLTWLQEMDAGKYAQSWTEAAPAFQKAVSQEGWTAVSTKVRTPLGQCRERKLASASRQTNLPSPSGAVDGDYILAQFDTSFDGLKYAVETVTFSKATDGSWKAAGYYIKPKA